VTAVVLAASVKGQGALRGRGLPPPEHVAYGEYLEHRAACGQCGTSLFLCREGEGLWKAFTLALPPARVPAWLQS
jgi:hypothetical protein